MSKNSRIGFVRVTHDLTDESPQAVATVFALAGFLPVSINQNEVYGYSVYCGTSEKFDELSPGQVIPTYTLTVSETDGKVSSVTVQREP